MTLTLEGSEGIDYTVSSGNFVLTFSNNLWKLGPIGFLKISVRNYYYLLCTNPEEHSSHTVFILTYLHVVRKEIMYLMMVFCTYDYLVPGLCQFTRNTKFRKLNLFSTSCVHRYFT
jgi:hypothetical protein